MKNHVFIFLAMSVMPPLLSANAQPAHSYAKSIVDTLSSPHFAGRGYLDNADGLAAAFIAGEFQSHGLSPVYESFEIPFPLTVDVYPDEPTLKINDQTLKLGIDYLPFPASASGNANNHQKVVHAGTGLFLPDLQINEYAGLDIKNAIVIIKEQIPDAIRKQNGVDPRFLSPATRIEIAHQLGANSVVLLTTNPLSHSFIPINAAIPAFILRNEALPEEIDNISYALNTHIDWQTTTSNVIAKVAGTSAPNEYLLVTAHYDHLGRIGSDFYFPGANDNASGVALTLALSKYFQENPLNRTVVFIGFSAEEQGLKGSRYFVTNPPFPLEDIRFLINLDMVASGNDGIMAVGGSDFAPEFELLSQVNDSLQLGRLAKRPNAPNSDHYYFLEQGVHGFFLYTNKGNQPYHHPHDLSSSLEWDDFEQMYDLVRNFLIKLDEEFQTSVVPR